MSRPTAADGVLAQEIARRRNAAKVREGWIRLGLNVVVLLFVLWATFTFAVCLFRVSGNDMYPAVRDGDVIVAWRLEKKWRQDDLVVFEVEGKMRAGRVVATGGDIVDISSSGALTVNGTPDSSALYETEGGDTLSYPYVVPDGEVFILGDLRTQAQDSREFGPVPEKDIKGTAIGLFRRRDF